MIELNQIQNFPVARLATVRPDGSPHVVPVTFAVESGDVVTAVDHKPKRHDRLQRLTNVEHEPRVSLIVDHWSDDWTELWWVRVDGTARVLDSDRAAVAALAAKYEHYRATPPAGRVIRIAVDDVRSWSASDGY